MSQTAHASVAALDLDLDEVEVLRQNLGLSQASMCRRAGIANSTYQRWLKYRSGKEGGCRPHARSLRVVCEVLASEMSARVPAEGEVSRRHAA